MFLHFHFFLSLSSQKKERKKETLLIDLQSAEATKTFPPSSSTSALTPRRNKLARSSAPRLYVLV
jgi:hypothetical protein